MAVSFWCFLIKCQQLKKVTPEDHPEFADISTACEMVEQMCTQINEKKKVLEELGQVLKIQKQLTGRFHVTNSLFMCFWPMIQNLVSTGRKFILQGASKVTGEITKRSVCINKDQTLFLFSDLLIITEMANSHHLFEVAAVLPLEQLSDVAVDGKHEMNKWFNDSFSS